MGGGTRPRQWQECPRLSSSRDSRLLAAVGQYAATAVGLSAKTTKTAARLAAKTRRHHRLTGEDAKTARRVGPKVLEMSLPAGSGNAFMPNRDFPARCVARRHQDAGWLWSCAVVGCSGFLEASASTVARRDEETRGEDKRTDLYEVLSGGMPRFLFLLGLALRALGPPRQSPSPGRGVRLVVGRGRRESAPVHGLACFDGRCRG